MAAGDDVGNNHVGKVDQSRKGHDAANQTADNQNHAADRIKLLFQQLGGSIGNRSIFTHIAAQKFFHLRLQGFLHIESISQQRGSVIDFLKYSVRQIHKRSISGDVCLSGGACGRFCFCSHENRFCKDGAGFDQFPILVEGNALPDL